MEATVIIPVLNEGPRLARCVEAVARQEGAKFEILVVDGGSTDGCLAALRCSEATVVHAPGLGVSASRNLGARRARGHVLAFTDGDCVPRPGWLRTLLDRASEPGVGGVGGALRHSARGFAGRAEDLETTAFYRGYITSNVAYHADVFREVGGFDPSLRCAEDWDLAWRVMAMGHDLVYCPEAVVEHDPPENEGYSSFLRKQFWYARNDVPVLLRRARGANGPGRRSAREFLGGALYHAASLALLGSVVGAPAGAVLWGGWALRRALMVRRRNAYARGRVAHLAAHFALKSLARGAGTWVGLADVARTGLAARRQVPEGPARPLKSEKRTNVRA
ncbi:MAG TPA: glycosyltransferase [Candidatus Thermoplasmatota archaeon]|nr:glycosyltransferase [Candidatus Thermoplasmatota archaeon]